MKARIANHHSLSLLGQKYDVNQASGSSRRTRLAQYAAFSPGPPADTGELIGAPGVRRGSCLGWSGELPLALLVWELLAVELGAGRAEALAEDILRARRRPRDTVAGRIPRISRIPEQ